MSLTPEERGALLTIARHALQEHLLRSLPARPEVPPALQEPKAAFVTLHLDGALRGCVGALEPIHPLAATVAQCAVSAATADPRFPPVDPEELSRLVLEISVLSTLAPLRDPAQLVLGTHGVCVTVGQRRGVLLPQVAAELGGDREAFLEWACRKAFLPADAWRWGAEIHIFTAEVFREANPSGLKAA